MHFGYWKKVNYVVRTTFYKNNDRLTDVKYYAIFDEKTL